VSISLARLDGSKLIADDTCARAKEAVSCSTQDPTGYIANISTYGRWHLHAETLRCVRLCSVNPLWWNLGIFRWQTSGHDAIFIDTISKHSIARSRIVNTTTSYLTNKPSKWPLSSSDLSAQPRTRPSPPCARPKHPRFAVSSPHPPSNLVYALAQRLLTSRPKPPQETSTSTNGSMENGRFCSRTRRTSRPCAPLSWVLSLSSAANSRRETLR
jgi:hypothetical protein